MRDLFQRLSRAGFDKGFVRSAVLPDWWDDDLAAVPFNRALAEGAVASHLPFTVAQLRDPMTPLILPEPAGECFKRNRGSDVGRCAASLAVVRRAAALVAANVPDLPAFAGPATAAAIREHLLAAGGTVDLASLAAYCWAAGVPVVPVARLPKTAVKFDGVAMWSGGRPLVVLASGRDGPPWLAFDLAHELGHIMRGHVGPGSGVHVDRHLKDGAEVEDTEEREADRFALELLTGRPAGLPFTPTLGLTGPKLATAARAFAAGTGIDPGIVCLFYARSADRWGAAAVALNEMGLSAGGGELLAGLMAAHLRAGDLSESAARFLEATCHLPPAVTDDHKAPVR